MSVVAIFSLVFFVPVLAAPIDYNDYVYKVEVVGDQDLVYVKIPAEMAFVRIYDRENNYRTVYLDYGQTHDIPFEPGIDYRVEVNLFGYRQDEDIGLDLSLIPPGTKIVSGMGFNFDGDVPSKDWAGMTIPQPRVFYHYYEMGNSKYIEYDSVVLASSDTSWADNIAFCCDTYEVKNVDNAYRLTIAYFWQPVEWVSDPLPTGITVTDTTLVFTISSLLRQQQMTGKTNELLKEVERQLADQGKTLDDIRDQMGETNEKLDDIITGGSAGEDLMNKNDQMTDISGDLTQDMDQIQDFEDQYFGQLESNLGDVVDSASLNFLYVPLAFVQRYLDKIVAAIPSKYLVVFTLPMLFGLFLYIVGHPVRAPRPERKSDSESRNSLSASRSSVAAPQKEVNP